MEYETQDCGTYWKVTSRSGKVKVVFQVDKALCATSEEAVAYVKGEIDDGKA